MKELSLKELRDFYPNIKATSKVDFISQVEAIEAELFAEEVVVVEENKDTIKQDELLEYIATQMNTQNKILIKCEDSLTADDLFLVCQYELFPRLNERKISVLASSTRRDMSLNGTCYIRICCKKNFDHLKRLMIYNTYKEIV